ncbi:MAG: single-stranded-DNA-specific exonuclease RecJ [Candidatus Aminicenantales bacterium]|jgi:single-stranded-DNA-specific exonuclease
MDDALWVLSPSRDEARTIASELGIPLPIAQVLVNRKILDAPAARRFLQGTMDDFNDPFLFSGMKAAVARIEAAIARGEKILIFGDYDVDGILSMVMLHKALTTLGGRVDYFIPERLKDGYGIKDEHVAVAAERGARLVISVDCGIKAGGFVRLAAEAGVDVIVTDHHLPGSELPAAAALLDPVVEGSGYPEKNLAGVGVVFKLIQALFGKTRRAGSLRHYLKLVALGTISDIAELRGENRLFVKHGLKELENVANPGLRSLFDVCGLLGRKISEGDVGFRIGPRINAAGRMGETDLAVRLFFATSDRETMDIARRLDALNGRRQLAEEKIFRQAADRVRANRHDAKYKILILGCEEWQRGVIGIVASRLKDAFRRPVVLFSYEDGRAYGSGRSIGEFSLIACLEESGGRFLSYGGHTYAVGCTLMREDLSDFRRGANAVAEARLTDEDLRKTLRLDAEVEFADIGQRGFLDAYALLSPFGVGNARPIFVSRQAEVAAAPQTMQGKHLKLQLRQNGRAFEAVGWDRAAWAGRIGQGDRIDVAYSLLFSSYLGEDKLQLSLEGARR